MKTKEISTILVTLSLGAFSAMASSVDYESRSTQKVQSPSATQGMKTMSHDHSDHMMMANEAHHVLAMAYHQNLVTFAKALHEQTEHASTVNVEFARTAVSEMRRSFGEMKLHHEEHVKTMSAEMHKKMSEMRKQMETHHTELITILAALEKEVQSATPDAKKVSTLAASVHTHCDAMTKMNHSDHEHEMKMKM